MTRQTPAYRAFSSGEIDPLLRRRSDYQRFQTGLAKCNGFIPLVQGGITRAPGTLYRGTTKANSAAVLIPFIFAADDACILEFTPFRMRVWRYGAPVLVAGTPYELGTPWDADDLATLRWQQTADVVYLVDGNNWPRTLKRLALDNWTLSGFVINSGPFGLENVDSTLTVQASAAAGLGITLTASASLFVAGHVNSLIWLTPSDLSSVPYWFQNEASPASIAVGDHRIYDGRIYSLAAVGANVGVTPPTHEKGTVATQAGVKWTFVSTLNGIARISAVASGTSATADVIQKLPEQVVSGPTYRWALGAWSDLNGWPSAVQLYDQRLVFAATDSAPRDVWFSAVGDFQDWFSGVNADDPFGFTIDGGGSINRILNLVKGKAGLHILALGQEFSSRAESRAAVIGPTTAVFGLDSAVGSAPAAPIVPYGSPIFITRDQSRIAQIAYNFQADANEVTILSRPSQHLGVAGFEEIEWTSYPQPMAWIRRSTGDLALMTYEPGEDVLGWATLSVAGGVVESMAVTPDPVTGEDVVTAVIRRTLNGATVRAIEEFAPWYGVLTGDTPTAEAQHLFCALTQTSGPQSATWTVAHLKNETVYAWTDEGEFGPLTVSGAGVVTLPQPVGRAHIGLFDATHAAETLDLTVAAPEGSADNRHKRQVRSQVLALLNSNQGFARTKWRSMEGPDGAMAPVAILDHTAASPMIQPVSGPVKVPLLSPYAREVSIEVTPYQGAPLTVLGIYPTLDLQGS